MIQYHVRARYLVDLYNEIKSGKLILSPYFQRKLVWRPAHKQDFIKTILLGYPFPEIFISRGAIDLESMVSTSCIVDGQQRMSSIRDFIEGQVEVEGKKYNDLSPAEKETFLKYEIAIIDLDLKNDDQRIIDIFKRLNRTFYALSAIEKLATEYASSEFMLTAKLIAGEFTNLDLNENSTATNIPSSLLGVDPNITSDFLKWANSLDVSPLHELFLKSPIFTKYEISRKVHLMFVLNLMATFTIGYYNRNEGAAKLVDQYAQDFFSRDSLITKLKLAATHFNKLKFKPNSEWFSKSNSFTLLCLIGEFTTDFDSLSVKQTKTKLDEFTSNLPADYALAAKEAVNNKKERLLRRSMLLAALFPDSISPPKFN